MVGWMVGGAEQEGRSAGWQAGRKTAERKAVRQAVGKGTRQVGRPIQAGKQRQERRGAHNYVSDGLTANEWTDGRNREVNRPEGSKPDRQDDSQARSPTSSPRRQAGRQADNQIGIERGRQVCIRWVDD